MFNESLFSASETPRQTVESQNQLDLKKAELKKTADKAAAEADMVKQTVTAEKQRELYVAQQEAQIAAETKKVELAERQVAVKEHWDVGVPSKDGITARETCQMSE